MFWKSFLVLLCLLPAAAWAECPTRSDLAKGIIFITDARAFVRHRTGDEGIIEVDIRASDGSGSQMQMAHGLYPIDSIGIAAGGAPDPATRLVFAEQATALGWPKPRADTRWTMPGNKGGAASAGPMQTIRWGACEYEMFVASLTFTEEPDYVESYQYLPQLGVGLLSETFDGNGPERYQYTLVTD